MADRPTSATNSCYWTSSETAPVHDPLCDEIEADVAIVGGGIVGVITARLLADTGRAVALLEARRVGHGVTGRSTAKVTAQHALALHRIEQRHGAEAARIYAEANRAAVADIAELVKHHTLACDFERADSFVYATTRDGAEQLETERDAAARAGLGMEIVANAGLPFPIVSALRLTDQAQLQPAAFVSALAATLTGPQCRVFEYSSVIDWDDDGVRTAAGSVRAGTTVMATHLPLGQVGGFYAHTHPHMHAVLALPVAAKRAIAGMYIGAEEPRRSLRTHRDASGQSVLILTGPRFTHGDIDGENAAFSELEDFARQHFGCGGGGWRWSNEDYTPRDGLPYIGWAGSPGKSLLVATGFDAWGLSNGAAAARIIAELIEGRSNPWAATFDASRHSAKGLGTLLGNAGTVATGLVGGHLSSHSGATMPAKPGESALVEIDGRVAGVSCDAEGRLHAVSAVCTHMGCMLGWNPVDRTWDCPCHGSRFGVDGEVRHGPATEPLQIIQPETKP
jgi:glycine/D-amino acid oxidase-like deaminating enzyme/nitrite reductase/ring-hydroxylating ferredoxin subunit